MNRKFTKLMAALALLLFIAPPMVGWGQASVNTITISYDDTFNPALPTSSSGVNTTATQHTDETANNFVFKEKSIYTGSYQGNSYIMFVKNAGFLYNTQDLGTITSVAVTYSASCSTSAKAGVYFGNAEQSTYTTSSNSTIAGTSQTDTWTNTTSGYGFFQFSTSEKNCQVTQIVITYSNGGSSTPSITIPEEQLSLDYEENEDGTFNVSYTNFTAAHAYATLSYDAAGENPFPTTGDDAWIVIGVDSNNELEDPTSIGYILDANPNTTPRTVYLQIYAYEANYSNYLDGTFEITQAGMPAPAPYINIVANHGETVENPYLIERPDWHNGGGFLREVEFGNFTVSGASDFQILYCNANGEPIDETPAMFSGVEVDYYYYQVFETWVYRLYVAVTNNHSTQARSGYFKVWVNVNDTPVYSDLVTVHQPGKPQVATPTFSPAAGAVPAGTEVAISCTTEGAAIQYSTDGTNYNEYTAPIVINEAMTLYAKATKQDHVDSEVATAEYTVKGNAEFVNGVYTESMATPASFGNMEVISVSGDESWVFSTTYNCAFIKQSDAQEDWLITPKMAVDNGKLLASFQIYHKNLEQNGIALKWSTSNNTSGTWQDVEFEKGSESGWRNVNDLVIETGDAKNIYLAFVYKNVNAANAQCQIRNLTVRQYYNVSFDANDLSATGTMDDLACVAGVATALTANSYAVEGRVFNGWNTQADGQGTAYVDGANITITANTTLYAQWLDTYKVKFTTNGIEDGTMYVVQGQAIGTLPTASPEYIPSGYVFMGWYGDSYFSEDTAPTYIASPYTPSGNVTLYAVFAEVSGSAASLTKMTSNDTFEVGDNVVIVADGNVAMYQQTTNTSYVNKYTFDNNVLTVAADNKNWFTVSAGNSGTWKLGDATNGYVYNSSSNDLKVDTQNATEFTLAWNTDNSKFTLVGNSRWLSYRKDLANKYFRMGGASTGSGSGVIYFDIYKYVAGSASYSNYSTSLTATSNLTINGYSSDGIKDGYYLIASPVYVDPATVLGMTSGDFDLYYFDEAVNQEEWRNYEAGNFTFAPGKGYLYAKKKISDATPTHSFTLTGAPYSGNGSVELAYTTGNQLAGWNLIGNPYANAALLQDDTQGDRAYYKMNDDGDDFEAVNNGATIAAMTGVFVYTETDGETVTFVEQQPSGANNNSNSSQQLSLNVSMNRGTTIDRAFVNFGNGSQLPKLQLNPRHTKVYFEQGNRDYAVVNSANEGEMPVNFKAENNGTYTLSVNAENVEMTYLHLIDNMTGADIDLLATPSYSFEATPSDYASRFRLVFSGSSTSSETAETFAYFNGSEWSVSNMGEATLQVVDMLGRIVKSETINGNATMNTANLGAGVYVMRLINGENVMTQKIVVR